MNGLNGLQLARCFMILWSALVALALVSSSNAQSIPASWRKPQITTTLDQQSAIAKAAIDVALTKVNQTTGADSTGSVPSSFYGMMALYDVYTNGTQYRDDLVNIFNALTARKVIPIDQLELGLSAMRAYQAYGDSVFFNMANTVYDYASKFIISYNDTTPTNRNKQFTIPVQCNSGNTMAGGVFWQDTPTEPSVFSVSTSEFAQMTSLMAEVIPNNADLISGAKAAAQFVIAHMFKGNFPAFFISANVTDNCAFNPGVDPSFPGWFLSGLSTIASITQDQDFINQAFKTAVDLTNAPAWQTTDGSSIIQTTDAAPIIPSLVEVYLRFPSNTSLQNYIKAYMGVQYNALLDLAAGNGTFVNTYAANWTGPPPSSYDANVQYQAISVLVSVLGLSSNATTSAGIPTTSLSSSSSSPTGPSGSGNGGNGNGNGGNGAPNSPGQDNGSSTDKKTNTGAIAGGVVGGLVVLAVCIAIAVLWHRRARRRQRSDLAQMDEGGYYTEDRFTAYHPHNLSPDHPDTSQVITPFVLTPQRPPPAPASGSSARISERSDSINPPTALPISPTTVLTETPASGDLQKSRLYTTQLSSPDSSYAQSTPSDVSGPAGPPVSTASDWHAQSPIQPLSTEELLSMLQHRINRERSVATHVTAPPAYSPSD